MEDFEKKLQDIFNKYPMEQRKHLSPKKGIEKEIQVVIENLSKHNWRIHKRSLPVGLDQPIMFNLSEDEANKYIKRLKPKLVEYNEETGQRTVHYYDKVRNDGYLSGVYDNTGEIIKEGEERDPEVLEDHRLKFIE